MLKTYYIFVDKHRIQTQNERLRQELELAKVELANRKYDDKFFFKNVFFSFFLLFFVLNLKLYNYVLKC